MTDTTPTPTPQKISALLAVAAIVTLGIAMYLTFTETWPVSYLIDLQAGSDGMYSPKLTFVITWVVLLLPFWLADMIIKKVKKKNEVV